MKTRGFRPALTLAAALAWTVRLGAATPSTAWKETIRSGEADFFAASAKVINGLQSATAERNNGTPMRGFHGKSHSALQAEFRVLPDLPESARIGVFGESKSYPAWVRFSNGVGFPQGDRKPDVRGLGIKVIGARGPKLLQGDEDAVTQDFLMTNGPTNPARDGVQFMAFAEGSQNLLTLPLHLARKVGAKESLRMLTALVRQTSRTVRSMATETFWSGAAIKFGPYAVKYFAKPAGAIEASLPTFGSTDFMRKELGSRLRQGDIRFDFFLQFYLDAELTHIEDASVEWLEPAAPPVKVAELVIRKRDLESSSAVAEDQLGNKFAYTPWHAPEELRPLGHMQRLRRFVYVASSKFRPHQPDPTAPSRFE